MISFWELLIIFSKVIVEPPISKYEIFSSDC
jgi:hypothetical protein